MVADVNSMVSKSVMSVTHAPRVLGSALQPPEYSAQSSVPAGSGDAELAFAANASYDNAVGYNVNLVLQVAQWWTVKPRPCPSSGRTPCPLLPERGLPEG